MTEDKQFLEIWYHYAAQADGFIGGDLRAQRKKVFLTQEQQRTMLQIREAIYNHLWLRLQSMPLPRLDQFATDVQRIVAKIESEEGTEAIIDREILGDVIRVGLEE